MSHLKSKMNFRLLFVAILCFVFSNNLRAQDYNEIEFSIIFGDCFRHDTVSLFINDFECIKSHVLTSSDSDGRTNVDLYQDREKCIVISDTDTLFLKRIIIDSAFKIKVMISGKEEYTNIFNLQNGKIIVIGYCKTGNKEGKTLRTLSAVQHKQNVQFD